MRLPSWADLCAAQAGAILGHFRRHLAQQYRIIELTPALFAEAMLAARKHRLRAYDGVPLAAALGCDPVEPFSSRIQHEKVGWASQPPSGGAAL
jgi:predicted nucleic acid-binding protein